MAKKRPTKRKLRDKQAADRLHYPNDVSRAKVFQWPICGVSAVRIQAIRFASSESETTCGNCKRILEARKRKHRAEVARYERLARRARRTKKRLAALRERRRS